MSTELEQSIQQEFINKYKITNNRDAKNLFFKELLTTSQDNGLSKKYENCFNGYINWINGEINTAKKHFKASLIIDEKFPLSLYGLGVIFHKLRDTELALEFFKRLKGIREFSSYAFNALGNMYRDAKAFNIAIYCYKESVKRDNNFSYPHNGLGIVYYKIFKYNEAIDHSLKSLEIDDNFAYPWDNLGNILRDTGHYKEADKCYRIAISKDNWLSPANAHYAMSQLHNPKKIEEAKKKLDKAIVCCNAEGNIYYAEEYKSLFINYEKKINITNKRKSSFETGSISTLDEILHETYSQHIDEYAARNIALSSAFLDYKYDNEESEYSFEVLRRWNSYTPIIANNYHISKGGGYFLKVGGKGIVIDPGLNFIDNFQGSGHSFCEIDFVLISHAHNDHTADFESILTLLYKYNDRIKGTDDKLKEPTMLHKIARTEQKSSYDINENERNEEFKKSDRRKIINFYITESVYRKYVGMLELKSSVDYNIHVIERGDEFNLNINNKNNSNSNIKVKVLDANHNDIISDRHSVGYLLTINNKIIIYTGDTSWTPEIEQQYKVIHDQYKEKQSISKDETILLVAHLGGFQDSEIDYDGKYDKNIFYKNHLGRLGLAKLIETLEPDICFISEFGEEFAEKREEITDIYRIAFSKIDNLKETIFLPADIGLELELTNKKIKAINDINNNNIEYDHVDPSKVKTILLINDYSLHYYNSDTITNERKLSQVLTNDYDFKRKNYLDINNRNIDIKKIRSLISKYESNIDT
ncbi:MAG: tetratricopeptide repeat protein [Nitrospirae bacterium]|nr:tetratricopeptide repeat protein [Nitrospirota bacterium]